MKFNLFVVLLIIAACQSQKPTPSTASQGESAQASEMCFGFDQRQCEMDDFASYLPKDRNSDGMFKGMQLFLSEAQIKVLHMRIDMNYYEMTCSACDICPEQHRFFVSIPLTDTDKLKNINLLNMSTVDCLEHF